MAPPLNPLNSQSGRPIIVRRPPINKKPISIIPTTPVITQINIPKQPMIKRQVWPKTRENINPTPQRIKPEKFLVGYFVYLDNKEIEFLRSKILTVLKPWNIHRSNQKLFKVKGLHP